MCFNENYLGHKIKLINEIETDFWQTGYCNNCNNYIHMTKSDGKFSEELYYFSKDGKFLNHKIMTCNKMIIKNLLE